MNEYKQDLIKDHMRSSRTYCYYCLESKGDKWHCCQENHFLKFSDFDEDTQKEFIAWEMESYEEWSKSQ